MFTLVKRIIHAATRDSGPVNNHASSAEEVEDLDYLLSTRPQESYVFVGDYYFPLTVKNEKEKIWLGRSKVILSDGKATFPEHTRASQPTKYESEPLRQNINRFLYEAKAAPLDNRIPVLTYGSNTNPQQLDQKFDKPGINKVIPLVKCQAQNLEVVFSAYETTYGFIAPTLIEVTGAKAEVFVAFHSREQLKHIEKELGDGYCFRHFQGENFRLQLDGYNNYLDEYYAFLPKKRALLVSETPRRVAHVKHYGKNKMVHAEIEHKKLYSSVTTTDFSESYRLIPGLQTETTKADIYTNIKVRSAIKASNQIIQQQKNVELAANPKINNRPKGDYSIFLPPNTGIRSSQVILSSNRKDLNGEAIKWRLLVKKTSKTSGETNRQKYSNNDSVADVDLTIRNALGIEVGESFRIEAFGSGWKESLSEYLTLILIMLGLALLIDTKLGFNNHWWHFVLPVWLIAAVAFLIIWLLEHVIPDNYLIMRMTPAAKLFEREACAMPEIAFDLLGIETGDKVVLEAVTQDGERNIRVTHCVVRAYKRDEISLNTALNLSTDDPDSVFADCSEILDVFPDIEPIIVNYDLRKQLGLENQKCAPIRVRISKQYRVAKEFRNGVIAILLVLIGTLSLFENQQLLTRSISSVIFVISLIVIAIMSFWALRERLSP